MDDDTEPINRKDNPSRTFYDSSRCIPKPNFRRQTRHAASDVGFRIDRDLVRISENDNVRRKRRTRPQHCPSCLSQSVHNHSTDARPNDHHRRKNPEKLEASLIQHVEYATSKIARSHGKSVVRSVHRQGSPLSPRAVSGHQRSRHHRPGTSQNRNNPDNTMGHCLVRKQGNIEPCECTRLASPLRDIVNSDDPSEDTDFRLPCEHIDSRNICRESDPYWHSPPGEPHSEPELDSPPQDRHRDYTDLKKRHNGRVLNSYDNYRALEAKVSIETGSSVDKDVREQYERDQQVLKDLYEDVGEFEKRKSAGLVANDLHEEKYTAWAHPPKQHPEEEDQAVDDSQYLLESINQFVGKLPVQRKGNTSRVSPAVSDKAKAYTKTQKEQQSRGQNSKFDTRKTYYSGGMDGRTTGSGDQQQELGRNSEDKLAGIHLESLKREEEKGENESKEVESLSETEEEARELAREDHATKQIHRQLPKSWDLCKRYSSTWKPRISSKEERTTRDVAGDKEEKIHGKPDSGKKEANTRERSKGRRKKEVMICEESEPLRQNHSGGTNEAEHKDNNRTNTRERSREKEGMADKMYEEFKNCYGVSVAHGAGDLELETSKTRTCIDEIIDSGLSREANRGSGETLRITSKDLVCEADGLPLRQGPGDGMSINIHPDGAFPVLRSDEYIRASRGDCFCKTLAEIFTDYQGPQEYIKKLKSCRLAYLNHMQSDLKKLYSLEKFLDSCSLERQPSSATLTTGFSPESKESKNISDKRDKPKGSGTQSRP